MALTSDVKAGTAPAVTMTVLFADVAGSTKLYDTLGDIQAGRTL